MPSSADARWWGELGLAGCVASVACAALVAASTSGGRAAAERAVPSARVLEGKTVRRDDACPDRVATILEGMPLRAKVGQLVLASALEVPAPGSEMRSLIEDHGIGSVIHFSLPDRDSAAAYNRTVQRWARAAGVPLLIAGDFEFGLTQVVARGVTVLPLQMALGATGSEADVVAAARITAREAKALGFNWAFAPVVDVNTNPNNPVIGVRAFSQDAGDVARLGAAQVRVYRDEGVIATPKHFPGHGDTAIDSHLGLPVVDYGARTLENIHLRPFAAAIDAGAAAIMTAHVVVPELEPEMPATLSRRALTETLRDDMGFSGVVVTDALNMAAIAERWGPDEAAVRAVRAGADVVMSLGGYEDHVAMHAALLDAVHDGSLSVRSIELSARRVLALKCRYGLLDDAARASPDALGWERHARRALEIAQRSITLLHNDGALPLARVDRLLVAEIEGAAGFGEMLARRTGAEVDTLSVSEEPALAEVAAAASAARDVDAAVVTTYAYSEAIAAQRALVEAVGDAGAPVVVVSLGSPVDASLSGSADAYVATYARAAWPHTNPTALHAAAAVLAGVAPHGRLPVSTGGFPAGHGLTYD